MNVPFELTARTVNSAKPRDKEYALLDSKLPGLSVRVQSNGAKSWVLRLSDHGKARRITLGRTKDISVRDARDMAADQIADLRLRKTQHIPKRTGPTFAKLVAEFQTAKQDVYKPTTLKALRSYLTCQLLPAFGPSHVSDITTPQVANWFHDYSHTSPGGANRALGDFRAILSFGRSHGLTPPDLPDPSTPLRKNKRPPRGRLLSTHQLFALGEALNNATRRQEDAAQAVHLILLTGCRSGEILRLQWENVKPDRLSLVDSKTGPRDVMLTHGAKAILRKRFAARQGRVDFVFPSPLKRDRPYQSIRHCWLGIRDAAGLPDDIRLHDLRHTYASHSIMGGQTIDRTGALLGHSDAQTTEIYSHLDGAHPVAAAERVSSKVAMLLGPY